MDHYIESFQGYAETFYKLHAEKWAKDRSAAEGEKDKPQKQGEAGSKPRHSASGLSHPLAISKSPSGR